MCMHTHFSNGETKAWKEHVAISSAGMPGIEAMSEFQVKSQIKLVPLPLPQLLLVQLLTVFTEVPTSQPFPSQYGHRGVDCQKRMEA